MPTHAELAGKLLVDAATFFRTLAQHNQGLTAQMTENAMLFEQVSGLVVNDPQGYSGDMTHAALAGRLLKDVSVFFLTLAENNEPIREQMTSNAQAYDQLGDLIISDPLGFLD